MNRRKHRPATTDEKIVGLRCHYCSMMFRDAVGSSRKKTRQHIVPKSEGGKSIVEKKHVVVNNYRPCCAACNNTMAIAMECPGMMMCAFVVAEDQKGWASHYKVREVLKKWGVNRMSRRPGVSHSMSEQIRLDNEEDRVQHEP